jgi:O-antigen/teichoic acid export membrane protein
MMRRLLGSTLLRQAGLYTAFGGLAGVFPVLLLPFITRHVAPSDYGIAGLFLVAVNISLPFISMGLETAVGRRFVDRGQIDFARYATTALTVSSGLALGLLVLALAAYPWLARVLPLPRAWTAAWVAIAWSEAVLSMLLVLLQMEERVVQHGWWRVGRTTATQVAIFIALLFGWYTWQGLVAMQTIAFIGVGLACLMWLRHRGYLVARVALADAKAALAYGVPLLPHMLGSAALVSVDRLLISRLIGVDGVGLFMAGAQFGQIMFVPAAALGRAWIPWFYARVKATFPESPLVLPQAIAAAAALVAVALLLSVAGDLLLPRVLGPSYAEAMPVFFWMVAAWTAFGCYGLSSAYLFYSHRTGWISAATGLTVLTNIGFALWLIPRNGITGAAQAAFIAYVLALVSALCLSRYFQEADRSDAVHGRHPLVATKHAA